MGYNFKCHKNTFYGLTIYPSALGCISLKFFPEPPWECKQLRDAGGHPEYIIPVFKLATLEHLSEKRKAQWTTFNFNTLKGIALEILSIKNANWMQFT